MQPRITDISTYVEQLPSSLLACVLLFIGFIVVPAKAIETVEDNKWPVYVKSGYTENEHDVTVTSLGPIFESTHVDQKEISAIRPLFLRVKDAEAKTTKTYVLYPLLSHERTEYASSWSLFGLVNKSAENNPSNYDNKPYAFSAFPFFTTRKVGVDARKSRGLFPLVGDLHSFWGNDRFAWFCFPLWLETEANGNKNYSFPWPFLRRTVGPDTHGGAFWPFAGHYEKKGVYKKEYCLWPLAYNNRTDLDKPIPHIAKGLLPFYCVEHAKDLESETFLWPFFGYVRKANPDYYERHLLWPLWVQGRGQEVYVNRWAPFYTHSITKENLDKKWFVWPLFKQLEYSKGDLAIKQFQFLYFLAWTQRQSSITHPELASACKTHVWPLFSYWNNGRGEKQFQFLSPLEVFFQENAVVRRLYTPLFALYRFHRKTSDEAHCSILFNLITYDKAPGTSKFTFGPLMSCKSEGSSKSFLILGGLLGFQKNEDQDTIRFLWLKIRKSPPRKHLNISTEPV